MSTSSVAIQKWEFKKWSLTTHHIPLRDRLPQRVLPFYCYCLLRLIADKRYHGHGDVGIGSLLMMPLFAVLASRYGCREVLNDRRQF